MDRARSIEHLRRDGDTIAAAVGTDHAAVVAACPGWTVADLTAHTGAVHRWAAAMVGTGAQERISRRDLPPAPTDPGDLQPWFRDGVAELVDTLARADLEAPMWTFGADRTVRFWIRRMTQETAVHRWDAEAATGAPTAIDAELAADGIDEFHDVFLPNGPPGLVAGSGRLHVQADDLARRWTFPFGDGDVETTATGAASDLLLFLWGRVPADRLSATGATELLARWQADVRI